VHWDRRTQIIAVVRGLEGGIGPKEGTDLGGIGPMEGTDPGEGIGPMGGTDPKEDIDLEEGTIVVVAVPASDIPALEVGPTSTAD
jgi:hypothetical protein